MTDWLTDRTLTDGERESIRRKAESRYGDAETDLACLLLDEVDDLKRKLAAARLPPDQFRSDVGAAAAHRESVIVKLRDDLTVAESRIAEMGPIVTALLEHASELRATETPSEMLRRVFAERDEMASLLANNEGRVKGIVDDALVAKCTALSELLRTVPPVMHRLTCTVSTTRCTCNVDEWYCQREALLNAVSPPAPPAAERWAWMEPQSEQAYGPFASERLAIEDASRELGAPDLLIEVGLCEPFEPYRYVNALGDIDDIIQRMEELATDDGWYIEDSIVEAEDGAEEALTIALATWAKRYLTSKHWQLRETEPPYAKTVDPATLGDPT